MNVEEVAPWFGILIALITGVGALFKWRSSVILVDPDVLKSLQDQSIILQKQTDILQKQIGSLFDDLQSEREKIDALSEDLQSERRKRRSAEARIDSLQHDISVYQKRLMVTEKNQENLRESISKKDKTIEKLNRRITILLEGIEVLTRQIIDKHDSNPGWTIPEGDFNNGT